MKYSRIQCIQCNIKSTQRHPLMFRCIKFSAPQDFSKRILVATNLFGRGMDIERVNIVFNYDMPEDSDTYLHRVARAGRFGTKGMMQHSTSIWLCL